MQSRDPLTLGDIGRAQLETILSTDETVAYAWIPEGQCAECGHQGRKKLFLGHFSRKNLEYLGSDKGDDIQVMAETLELAKSELETAVKEYWEMKRENEAFNFTEALQFFLSKFSDGWTFPGPLVSLW